MPDIIDYQTDPSRYRHWRVEYDGDVAYLIMDVDQAGGLSATTSSSSIPTISASTSSWTTRCSGCASSIPRCAASSSSRARTTCSAPAPISACSARRRTAHKVNFCKFTNETRLAIEDASREFQADLRLRRSTAMRPAAATSSRSPPITSCWSTTAARRWRCRRRRCSRCCPAPAGSPASPTSARCGATAPTSSARSRKACAARARSSGGWSTRWCRTRNGKTPWRRARRRSRRRSDRPKGAKGITLTPLARKIDERHGFLFARRGRDRPRARARDRHRARAGGRRAGIGRGRARAGRQVLAARRGARAGRRDPASALQRGGDRRGAVPHRRRARKPCWSTTISSPRPMATG